MLATPAQHRAMWALWHERKITNRDIRLATTSGIIRRIVRSSTTLTRGEASQVIDRLRDTDILPGAPARHP